MNEYLPHAALKCQRSSFSPSMMHKSVWKVLLRNQTVVLKPALANTALLSATMTSGILHQLQVRPTAAHNTLGKLLAESTSWQRYIQRTICMFHHLCCPQNETYIFHCSDWPEATNIDNEHILASDFVVIILFGGCRIWLSESKAASDSFPGSEVRDGSCTSKLQYKLTWIILFFVWKNQPPSMIGHH